MIRSLFQKLKKSLNCEWLSGCLWDILTSKQVRSKCMFYILKIIYVYSSLALFSIQQYKVVSSNTNTNFITLGVMLFTYGNGPVMQPRVRIVDVLSLVAVYPSVKCFPISSWLVT